MRDLSRFFLLYMFASPISLHAQVASTVAANDGVEQRVEAISTALTETRKQLDESQQKIARLEAELAAVRQQMAGRSGMATGTATGTTVAAGAAGADAVESAPVQEAESSSSLQQLKERLETAEAQIKVHDQTKVESGSKYPVKVTGLILFNGFLNHGSVDNIDLPSIATRQQPGTSNGSAGATMRQTILGLE